MRGATGGPPQGRGKTRHFNPRTPRGVRLDKRHLEPPPELEFQSTRPMRGATRRSPRRDTSPRDFNPRAPCGARLGPERHQHGHHAISIHAPHAGRDRRIPGKMSHLRFQSTHPSRGATRSIYTYCLVFTIFQSTRPMRGATPARPPRSPLWTTFQSTRPVRGATLLYFNARMQESFQSTRPVRGATTEQHPGNYRKTISIRAPRAGRDEVHDHRHT